MISMTQSIDRPAAQRKHNAAMRAALIVVFWGVAALLVAVANRSMYATSPVICVAIEVVAIVAVAGMYVRLIMPESTLDHALLVGTTWVLLGIAAEIAMTANQGRQWTALIGSPDNGGLRCVILIAWIIAPALFVRSRE